MSTTKARSARCTLSERRTTSFDARWIEKSEVDASGTSSARRVYGSGPMYPPMAAPMPVPTSDMSLACAWPQRTQSARLPRRANDAMMRARDAVCATLAVVLIALAADAITKKCCG